MKSITITYELTLTLESFKEWCKVEPTETTWKTYVEKMLWSQFGISNIDYNDLVNKTIETKGIKITILENQ